MGDIYATFTNHNDESRHYTIEDLGRDRNNPPKVFEGYLDEGHKTDWILLHSDGHVRHYAAGRSGYEKSDIRDGDNIDMD
jgi:hypothetical protein